MSIERRGLSIAEAANRLGKGKTFVYDRIRDGDLIARKLGGRTVVLVEDIDRLLDHAPHADLAARTRRAER